MIVVVIIERILIPVRYGNDDGDEEEEEEGPCHV